MPNDRLLQSFVHTFADDPQTFTTTIHVNDEMYLWNDESARATSDPNIDYLLTGRRMLSNLRPIVDWAFGGFEGVGSVLDFASGYGRLTRHLIQNVPAERIWISDIQTEGVEFQREQFGVHGFVSTAHPQDLPCDRKFDLVFVASLFSHLPHRTFSSWLDRLYSLLTDRGILVFSVHDISLTDKRPDRRGMAFIARSESDRLDPDTYGTSYVSESYVEKAVRSVTGRRDRVRRIQKGLCNYQDLYVVAGESRDDLDSMDTSLGLVAYIDDRSTTAKALDLVGWAHDFSRGGNTTEIITLVNGEVVDRCPSTATRSDVAAHFGNRDAGSSGWSVSLPLAKLEPDDVVGVRAVSTSGRDLVLVYDTVAALRPPIC